MKFKQTIYDRDELKDIESAMKKGDLVLFEGNNQYDVSVYIHRNGILEYDTDLTTTYKTEKDLLGGRKSKKNKSKKNKSKKNRSKRHRMKKNKTKKRGGGLFNLLGTASRVSVGIRNIKYIKTLENRLVNTHNDYDWVQARRAKNIMPPLNKYEYTDNDWTSDK
jgi:hypothetical protein